MAADQRTADLCDSSVDPIIADYLRRLDEGEAVDRDAFLRQHEGAAAELRAFFEASDTIEQMAGPTAGSIEGQTLLSSGFTAGETNGTRLNETAVPRSRQGRTPELSLPLEFGRYRLMKLLGEGAMGSVYLAHDSQLDREVALKMPKFAGDEQQRLVDRFHAEAKAAATLRHPNLCPVYDVGQHQGRHYLTMAFIDGQPLSRYIRQDKPVPAKHALTLVRKIALALQEAHNKGVVHRDLKPGNIIIDKRGEPMVMDFGLAHREARVDADQGVRATQSGEILGTPAYMSPEQVEGCPERIGRATDVYSLGVILFELLTGRLPFTGSVGSVMGQILHKEPPDISALRPEIDPRVTQICRRMMAKEPGKRYESMEEVAEWLGILLRSATAPTSAPTKTPPPKPSAKPAPTRAAKRFTSQDAIALIETARAFIQSCDYAQATELLYKVPGSHRDKDFEKLLKQATDLQEEVDFLIGHMDEAARLNDNEALESTVKRLLTIKPGYKPARQLLEDLQTYGRAQRRARDSRGPAHYHQDDGIGRQLLIGGILIALLAVVVYLGATFFLQTRAGTVRVTVYDPSVTVMLDEEDLKLVSDGITTTVRAGDHTLYVRQPGVSAAAREFTVEKGDVKIFSIELIDGELAIAEGDGSATPAEVPNDATPAESEPPAEQPTTPPPVEAVAENEAATQSEGYRIPDLEKFATVEVPGNTPFPIDPSEADGSLVEDVAVYDNWPEEVSRGFLFLRGGNRKIGGTEPAAPTEITNTTYFEIETDGLVYMLLSGRPAGGGGGGEWQNHLVSTDALKKAGWEPLPGGSVDMLNHPSSQIYVRNCQAGETFSYSWEKYTPPVLLVPRGRVAGN